MIGTNLHCSCWLHSHVYLAYHCWLPILFLLFLPSTIVEVHQTSEVKPPALFPRNNSFWLNPFNVCFLYTMVLHDDIWYNVYRCNYTYTVRSIYICIYIYMRQPPLLIAPSVISPEVMEVQCSPEWPQPHQWAPGVEIPSKNTLVDWIPKNT